MSPPIARNRQKRLQVAVSQLVTTLLAALLLARENPASALGPAAKISSDEPALLVCAAERDADAANARRTAWLEYVCETQDPQWRLTSAAELYSLPRKDQTGGRRPISASSRRRMRSLSRQQATAREPLRGAPPLEPLPWRTLLVLVVFLALLRWRWLCLRDC